MKPNTRVRLRHIGDNIYLGSIDCPTTAGRVITHAIGETQADALLRASAIAERITSDPVMQALMPPQAQVAIAAAKNLASAAKRGKRALRRLWGRIRGPGKKRLATALMKEAHEREADVGDDELSDEEIAGIFSSIKKRVKKFKKLARIVKRKKKKNAVQREQEREQPDEQESEDEQEPQGADDDGGDEGDSTDGPDDIEGDDDMGDGDDQ